MGGFIPGSRGSFMLDLVVVAMVAVLPLLAIAVRAAKRQRYLFHKQIMLGLATVLLIAVLAFEVEMRLLGWRHLAEPSPYYGPILFATLGIHLLFSVTAAGTMLFTILKALRLFPSPPMPNQHSMQHKRTGKIAVFALGGTAITGWIFYWLAFIAT